MAAAEARARAAERIHEISRRGLDVAALWRACDEVLAPIVPHMMRPCWFTLDPDSLIVTSHYDAAVPSLPPEALAHEYAEEDVMNLALTARLPAGAVTVHEATDGDPRRSPGWRMFVEPFGADQQLAVALRTSAGVTWGVLTLYRPPGEPLFSPEEIAFLRAISLDLALGARRGLIVAEANEPGPNAAGLVVLDEAWQVQSLSPGVDAVLAALPGGEAWRSRGVLPPVLLAVAGRAAAAVHDENASARVRTAAGYWVTIHGAPLMSEQERRTAIILERSGSDRISPLLMAVYGLTEREQAVTRLVLRGESTDRIAGALHLSPHTVQEHLKHVFEKIGVHSRRDLVGRVFSSHYEPRVRDNDERAATGRPFVGTPVERAHRA